MQERVKEEFQERYGADLSDSELRDAARADMLKQMEKQLESEGVDVKGVTNVMEEMSRRNRELFALPPYVLYVARAFSTLEGIGLSIDENYAIVQVSCIIVRSIFNNLTNANSLTTHLQQLMCTTGMLSILGQAIVY